MSRVAPPDRSAHRLADQLAERYGVGVAGRLRAEPLAAQLTRGLDPDRVLPVRPDLAAVLPGAGLHRGSVVVVSGSPTLTLALLAAASAAGTWCAVVGMPTLGPLAAAELGLDVDRLALVPDPGPDWAAVVAALVDTLDLVVLRLPAGPRQHPGAGARDRSRLAARLRERGAVLVVCTDRSPAQGGVDVWPGADLRLRRAEVRWHGLGDGAGRLRGYELTVEVGGRRLGAGPRRAVLRVGAAPAAREHDAAGAPPLAARTA